MSHKQIPLTPEGLAKLEAELEYLRTVRRSQVAEQIHLAKELGTSGDDAEYDDAKNLQGFVEGRILELENIIKNAVIIPAEAVPPEFVKLGSRVTVRDQDGQEEHYVIVGSAEVDPNAGKISNESPVGRALLGRKVGEEVQVMVPAGLLQLRVVKIE